MRRRTRILAASLLVVLIAVWISVPAYRKRRDFPAIVQYASAYTVSQALARGADPNAPRTRATDWRDVGLTPLMAVSRRTDSWSDFVAMDLMDRGARIDARDAAERTPLHHAVEQRNASVAFVLLEAGADPFTPDIADMTPAMQAVTESWTVFFYLCDAIGALGTGQQLIDNLTPVLAWCEKNPHPPQDIMQFLRAKLDEAEKQVQPQ